LEVNDNIPKYIIDKYIKDYEDILDELAKNTNNEFTIAETQFLETIKNLRNNNIITYQQFNDIQRIFLYRKKYEPFTEETLSLIDFKILCNKSYNSDIYKHTYITLLKHLAGKTYPPFYMKHTLESSGFTETHIVKIYTEMHELNSNELCIGDDIDLFRNEYCTKQNDNTYSFNNNFYKNYLLLRLKGFKHLDAISRLDHSSGIDNIIINQFPVPDIIGGNIYKKKKITRKQIKKKKITRKNRH
jgi:hypothetical protein